MGNRPLRVDFVCTRADGSTVRLHPGQTMEAKIVEGVLENWRKGKAAIHARPSWPPLDPAAAMPSPKPWVPPPPPGPPPDDDSSVAPGRLRLGSCSLQLCFGSVWVCFGSARMTQPMVAHGRDMRHKPEIGRARVRGKIGILAKIPQ